MGDGATDILGQKVVIAMLDVEAGEGYNDVVDILCRLELAFGILE